MRISDWSSDVCSSDLMTSPLAGRGPQDIDFIVVRENVEGEYSEIGGRLYAGTDQEMVSQLSCFTRRGTDRILEYAFELARKRQRKHVTSATKSNGIVQIGRASCRERVCQYV